MRGLMMSKDYCDVRCGRLTLAMKNHGIEHDALCFRQPPQYRDVYSSVTVNPFMRYEEVVRRVRESCVDVIHVHSELWGSWLVSAAKEGADGRPVVMNVHDLNISRTGALYDPYESLGLEAADAIVWISEQQRQYALDYGFSWKDKPECFITNYVSSSSFVDKPLLPHVGGVCYGGGIAKRGDGGGGRDLSNLVDAIGEVHIYAGGQECDYGIVHPPELDYNLFIQRMAVHDWGLSGHFPDYPGWTQTMPTKVTEYFAAGLPGIYIGSPLCKPFAERGMGVYCSTLADVRKASRLDPKPYHKAVMAQRGQFTTEAIIEPLVDLYRSLT